MGVKHKLGPDTYYKHKEILPKSECWTDCHVGGGQRMANSLRAKVATGHRTII